MQADKLMLAKEAMSRAHIMHDDQQHEVVCVWPADWTAIRALLALAEGAEADRAALRELADEFNGCGDHSRHKQAAEAWRYCAKKVAALAGAVTQGEAHGND